MPAAPSFLRWLPPASAGAAGRCEWKSARAVDGSMAGQHRSAKKGASVEFSDYRQYVPGDDPRTIDWKVYGRKDRYYVKRTMAETNARVLFCLDCSGSMEYCGDKAAIEDGRRLSKFEYAKFAICCMASMFIGQQDAVGFASFDTEVRDYLRPKSGKSRLFEFLQHVDDAKTGKETDLGPVFDDIAERLPQRGVVIVASDLLGDTAPLLKSFRHIAHRKHELVVLHIMADEELDFSFNSSVRFQDLEGTTELEIDPKAIRADYVERAKQFVKTISDGCGAMRADYVPLRTSIPFTTGVTQYLARRANGF